MTYDWRSLLGEHRVPWADRGPNTSPENINVACPWCGNDPSYHLAISTTKDGYYCFRDNRHRGRNMVYLAMAVCDIGRYDATRLLNTHLLYTSGVRDPITPAEPTKMLHAWNRFQPAGESQACLDFLADRGFPDPVADTVRYNLRYAQEGEWAGRLLVPLTIGGAIISWTGRLIGDKPGPKYRTQPAPGFPVLYAPRQDTIGEVTIVVEGPLDALKIASACHSHQPSILPVALCGKQLNAAKLMEIRWYTSGCKLSLVALDADVKLGEIYEVVAELSGALRIPVRRIALPAGAKDPGELAHERIMPWLKGALGQ